VWTVLVSDLLENNEESDEIVDLKEFDEAALLLVDSCEGRRKVVVSARDWRAGMPMCSMIGNSG
jgi:hypothetical protein